MKDMTTGPVRGHVLSMMAFMLFGMVLQTLYALIDIYWVGQLGKEAVAAVALASNLMFLVLALSQSLAVGAVALISQAFGRKDEATVQRLFNQSQSLSALAALLFLLIGWLGKASYAQQLASDAQTAWLAVDFLNWFIPAQALLFLMTGLGAALRGTGNMKPGLIVQTASVLVNMVLAPILILGWGTGQALGVAGAGLATFIATLFAVVGLSLYLARAGTYLRVDFAQWRPDWATWRRMLSIGLPSGTEFLLVSVILALVYVVIRPFGAEAQAGFGIGMRILQAGFMPAVAISFAVAAVAGQNLGAGLGERVRQSFSEAARLAIGFMLIFTVLCQFAAGSLVAVFSDDPAVVQVGSDYLRVISWSCVASGLVMAATGLFQGLGNTLPSLLASASRLLTFVLPVLWLSQQQAFALHQVWWLSTSSVFLQMLLALLLLRREFARRLPT